MFDFLSDAQALIERAISREPRLARNGVWTPKSTRQRSDERDLDFGEFQDSLLHSLDEVATCAAWILRQPLTKQVNMETSSYTYKHIVEDTSKAAGGISYVSNGAFIAAALGLGLITEAKQAFSPHFNISRHISEDSVIDHTSFRRPHPLTYGKASPFCSWLRKQKKREDPVGDLAEDALNDATFPKTGGIEEVRSHLWGAGACSDAREALETAYLEFKSSRKRTVKA